MQRYDKIGRRIPEFDRSAAAKKGAKTKKEKYGPDKHSRDGSLGARMRTRGYFGQLKAEDPKKLTELAKEGAKKSNEKQLARKLQTEVRGAEGQSSGQATDPQISEGHS